MGAFGVKPEKKAVPVRRDLFEMDKTGHPVLLGSRCRKCGEIYFPSKSHCDGCHVGDLEIVRFGRRGKIHTFAIVRQASPEFRVPYAIGRVDVEEGVRVFTQLVHDELEKIEIGQEVELVLDRLFEEADGTEILGYKYRIRR